MSERLMVVKALAAMMGNKGDVTEEEVMFVGHAAFEMGLTEEENEQVQGTLKEGGDYKAIVGEVSSRTLRTFFFRRVVAAIMLDDRVDDAEQAIIDQTAEAFGYDNELKDAFVDWMKDGIEWEKRGAEIMSKM